MNQETKSTNCPLRGAIKRVIIQLRKLIKLILSQNGFPIVQMRLRTTAKSLAIRRCRIKDVENRGVLVRKKIRWKTQQAQCRNDWQSRAMFDIGFHRLESSWIDWGSKFKLESSYAASTSRHWKRDVWPRKPFWWQLNPNFQFQSLDLKLSMVLNFKKFKRSVKF